MQVIAATSICEFRNKYFILKFRTPGPRNAGKPLKTAGYYAGHSTFNKVRSQPTGRPDAGCGRPVFGAFGRGLWLRDVWRGGAGIGSGKFQFRRGRIGFVLRKKLFARDPGERLARFVFEDDGFREEAVTEIAARAGEFALRGDGATGAGAFDAGGDDATFGTHAMPYYAWLVRVCLAIRLVRIFDFR